MKLKGFTLMELMITLVVLSILATLAFINFTSYLASKKLETMAFRIYKYLNYYKIEAYKKEASYIIKISSNGQYMVVYDDRNKNNVVETADDPVIDTFFVYKTEDIGGTGVYLEASSNLINNGIVFNADNLGFPPANSGSMYIKHKRLGDTKYYKITIPGGLNKINFYRFDSPSDSILLN